MATDGKKYATYTAYVKADAGGGGSAWGSVWVYETTGCSGYLANEYTNTVSNQDWTEVRVTTEIPATAQSVRVWVSGENTSSSGPVYVDEVQLFSSEPTAVGLHDLGARGPRPAPAALAAALLIAGVGAYAGARRESRSGSARAHGK